MSRSRVGRIGGRIADHISLSLSSPKVLRPEGEPCGDLMAKDSNGLSDPYFKVKYGAFAARRRPASEH